MDKFVQDYTIEAVRLIDLLRHKMSIFSKKIPKFARETKSS